MKGNLAMRREVEPEYVFDRGGRQTTDLSMKEIGKTLKVKEEVDRDEGAICRGRVGHLKILT